MQALRTSYVALRQGRQPPRDLIRLLADRGHRGRGRGQLDAATFCRELLDALENENIRLPARFRLVETLVCPCGHQRTQKHNRNVLEAQGGGLLSHSTIAENGTLFF